MESHDKMRFIRRRCGLRQVIVIAALFVLSLTYKLYRDHHWLHHVLDVIIVEEHHEVISLLYSVYLSPIYTFYLNVSSQAHSLFLPPFFSTTITPFPPFPTFAPIPYDQTPSLQNQFLLS